MDWHWPLIIIQEYKVEPWKWPHKIVITGFSILENLSSWSQILGPLAHAWPSGVIEMDRHILNLLDLCILRNLSNKFLLFNLPKNPWTNCVSFEFLLKIEASEETISKPELKLQVDHTPCETKTYIYIYCSTARAGKESCLLHSVHWHPCHFVTWWHLWPTCSSILIFVFKLLLISIAFEHCIFVFWWFYFFKELLSCTKQCRVETNSLWILWRVQCHL